MLDQFIRHIREKNLLDLRKTYLLAISGGLDSVCLAKMLKAAEVKYVMAHCNFGLRGNESKEDERFVRNLGKELDVEVVVERFGVKTYCQQMGISTQMAARDLRYRWFEKLRKQKDLAGIIVAHHNDDQLETVLLNLLRGTGIEGVYGMSEVRGQIIRPLLPFRREQLERYAQEQEIAWREDSTNSEIDYKRNYLRHKVIPLLRQFDEGAIDNLQQSFERIKDTGRAFFFLYESWISNHLIQEDGYQYLKKESLNHLPGQKSLLYYWLRDFGFNNAQVDDVLTAMQKGGPGKQFESSTHLLNLDREYLILGERWVELEEISIITTDVEMDMGSKSYDILHLDEKVPMDTRSECAMLDRDKLEFPLVVRKWEEGDRFRPLGMKKFKKISDFLIDLKVPLIRKKNVKLLCDANGEVVWVIGYRVDDRFKVSPFTRSVLYFKSK